MKTNQSKSFPNQLPPYLGYGILDECSIQFENGSASANYVFECDKSLVHQVSWKESRCTLETFCQGEKVRMTSYPTLKQALLADCMTWSLHSDNCFQFLGNEVSKLGNIYVNHPKPDEKNTSVNYFPAGKLFLFSLPMLDKSPAYFDFLEDIKEDTRLRFMRERNGLLLLAKQDSSIIIEHLVIADFIVPLAHLVSAAKRIVEAAIIQKEKRFRLIVDEANNAERSFMQSFIGDENYPNFGLCYKEIEAKKIAGLKEMFRLQVESLSNSTPLKFQL